MIPYLPLNEINAQYESDIEAAVKRILCRGWYILGEECSAFEREYAQYIGTSSLFIVQKKASRLESVLQIKL